MQPLRIGLIGAGNISGAHLPAYRNHTDRLHLAAVCDASEARAAAVAEKAGVKAVFSTIDAMLGSADIDAVDICLPHYLHYPAAMAALHAGMHVFVEKPLAVHAAECVEMVRFAESQGLTLMVGQMRRFLPGYRRLRALIRGGSIGTVRHARVDGIQNLRDYAAPPHWLYRGDEAGGGGVISVLVHGIDTLRYLIGDARSVAAFGKTVDEAFVGAEDYAVAIIEFENGAVGNLFSTYSASAIPYSEMFWLFGDLGVVHTLPDEGKNLRSVPRVAIKTGDRSTREFHDLASPAGDLAGLPSPDPFANELLHFADCVRSGDEPLSSGRDNLGTMAIIFGIYESIKRGGAPVDVAQLVKRG